MLAVFPSLACETQEESPEPPACVDFDAATCAPLFAPTFDDVFTRTLVPSCATGGGSCHASAAALGAAEHGFFVDDADATHARLLEDRGEATFVDEGDPACSQIIVRLAIDDDELRMPPGSELAAGEICSVAQWIEMGALR
jgi:hypothetical protein